MTPPRIPLRDLVVSAIAELEQDRLESAQSLLTQAVEAAPHEPVPLYLLGTVLYRRGLYIDAEPLFRRALDISPGQPDTCFHLAQTLRVLKRPAEAIHFCGQALHSRPGFTEAALELAQAQTEMGALAEAEQEYRRLLSHTFNLTAVLKLTTLLNQRDSFSESETILRQSLRVLEHV